MNKKIFLVIIIALVLRLISLNQSLWLDEAISANVVKNYSYTDILGKFSPSDFHPPLYYFTLKAWTSVFGFSEISLRFPSIIFSLITIYLVFRFFGFYPSLLLSLNPLYLYYSQEARMYSLVTLLVFCAYLAFKKINYLSTIYLSFSLCLLFMLQFFSLPLFHFTGFIKRIIKTFFSIL